LRDDFYYFFPKKKTSKKQVRNKQLTIGSKD